MLDLCRNVEIIFMHKDNEIISHVPMSVGSSENVPLSDISLYIYIFVCELLVIHLLRCLCFILIGSLLWHSSGCLFLSLLVF